MESDFSIKNIGIIGAGPVGSILAAFLEKGGCKVTICDIQSELLEPINKNGIKIDGVETIEQKISKTCTKIDELIKKCPDIIFITTKANALTAIGSEIAKLYYKGLYIVSWQNGIDTELELAKFIDKKYIIRAVVNYGCELKNPGHVNMTFHNSPHYMQELDKETSAIVLSVTKILTECGLPTERTQKIIPMIWRKSIMNASMNPVTAVTGLDMKSVIKNPATCDIVSRILKECIKIAQANQINIKDEYYDQAMEYMKKAGAHKPSMLMDIENNRRTEIDFINVKFAEYGKKAGTQTPYNNAVISLLKGIEFRLFSK